MNNIPRNTSLINFKSTIKQLFTQLGICSLLKQANFRKRSGYGASVYELFFMVFSSCFFSGNKTVYSNFTSLKQSNVTTSKSSLYRFLANEYNNWRKFQLLLCNRVISKIRKLSDNDRKFCFILDDSVLERAKGKEVELMARTFNHVSGAFVKGFTCLQLGWTDGVSYFPVNSSLLSSSRDENRYRDATKDIDKRSCDYQRRIEAQRKKTEVAVGLLEQSLASGIDGDYVLMDTWFTTEPLIRKVVDLGLDVIGMVKQLKQRYWYNGEQFNHNKLFKAIPNKKNADIICSAVVETKNGIQAKIVYVRNRNIHRERLAILINRLKYLR